MAEGNEFEIQEIPHNFEIDVRRVVLINHEIVLEGITRAENEAVEQFDTTDDGQRDLVTWIERQHDEFRRAANNLALVGLITRLHHWLCYLANLIRPIRTFDNSLAHEFRFLSNHFANPPVELFFFDRLVGVRDSIIHADSKASWTFRGDARHVDPKYVEGDEVSFTEEHLKEVFDKALSVVEYFEHHAEETHQKMNGPQIKFGS